MSIQAYGLLTSKLQHLPQNNSLLKNDLNPFSFSDYVVHPHFGNQHSLVNFLQFSKISNSQNLSTALEILEPSAPKQNDHNLNLTAEKTPPIREIFDLEGRIIQLTSSDNTVNYTIAYDGNMTTITNQATGEAHLQETDNQGRLIREIFPCGLEISLKFDGKFLSEVTLPDQSKVVYQQVDQNHLNIQRVNPDGNALYQHTYQTIDDSLIQETLVGKAGTLQRLYDEPLKSLITKSDYLCVVDQYDEDQNLTSRTFKDPTEKISSTRLNYLIGDLLAAEQRQFDNQGRVIQYNGYHCSYDGKGRLIQKTFANQTMNYEYDAFDRLISVEMGYKKVEYSYDLLGRRLSKTKRENGKTNKEFYLYQGVNQIGVYNQHKEPIHLRALGAHFHTHLPFAIAIESQGKIYAPIYSSNYNILQLIDKDTKEIIHYESLNPFGENLQDLNPVCPWIFATKHYDPDTGLVDFGDRLYDPSIKQWTSADADPRALEEDLYSYCNNNPLKYTDPDGRFVIFIPLLLGWKAAAIALGWGLLAGGATVAANKAAQNINNKDLALAVGGIGGWAAGAALNKIKEMPFPDRELPQDQYGNPIPDTVDPHTQLGQHQGRKEKYPKAREFGKEGEHIRDIEFTDHCRPENHPIPHQHQRKDNPTGGTKERGNPESVPEWNYGEG